MYRPPSLNTLRALEAAARLRSFSRAAEELGVTHGAISHRVREVEQRLGAAMFERQGNSMEPSMALRQILPTVRQSLELISSIFPAPPEAGRQVLRIAVLPSFAAQWLVPRLAEFHEAHPGIFIALDARIDVSRVGADGVDAAVRYGSGNWPGLAIERLLTDMLFPACSPEYRARMKIETLDDFARCRFLRNSWQTWTPWFQRAGLSLPEPADSQPYDDAALMLEATIAGHGIALARRVIAHDALQAERLVRLSEIEIPFEGAYHFVWDPHTPKPRLDAVAAFGAWLSARLRSEFP
ncbi:LysR family glycine cleavage system transcriptional activator [Novosphingobium sp. PhB165]|uniref:LysR substrate-binding domain-containing protein n=1 Tax=Novosphingobium sp. PhB165 TaxID=2485105 RepID=UPI0010DDC1AD|nr:LysR substrate-binding domain-containing protein [Novosphingobium sp. PhB165]TCM15723.1 LysR family glycine cleavage system transcriptional activator [Novosphingobium sp. PhB165]